MISPRLRRQPSEELKSQAAVTPVAVGGRRAARRPTPGQLLPGCEPAITNGENSPQGLHTEALRREAEGQQGAHLPGWQGNPALDPASAASWHSASP